MSGFSLTSGQSLIGQVLAWSFLPPLLTNLLLRFLTSAGLLPPAKNAQQQQQWANRARALVILLYLGHNLLRSVQNAPISYYGVLGLPSGTVASEEEIRRRYRTLARIYHPDKIDSSMGEQASLMFVQIRSAVELLSDPDKRAAYDRFGPDVAGWRDAITLREHMEIGLRHSAMWYVANQAMHWAVLYFNGGARGNFWPRFLAIGAFVLEVQLLISPSNPSAGPLALLFSWAPNTLTAFTAVRLLRECYLSLTMAVQQLNNLLPMDLSEVTGAARRQAEAEATKVMLQNAQQIAHVAQVLENHNKALVRSDLEPFRKAATHGPDALPDAARKAATAAAASGAASAGEQVKPVKDDKMRSDWTHLVADALLAGRLARMPQVLEVLQRAESQSAGAQRPALGPSATAPQPRPLAEPPSQSAAAAVASVDAKQPVAASARSEKSGDSDGWQHVSRGGTAAASSSGSKASAADSM